MTKVHHITVATDLSPQAHAAIERGLQLAGQHDSKLLALSVVPPVVGSVDSQWWHRQSLSPEEISNRLRSDIQARLEHMLAEARPDLQVDARVVEGRHPHLEIVRAAHAAHSDLIVTGAHGGHFLHRLLVGTTAERVVRRADRPVLVVKESSSENYRKILVPTDFSPLSEVALQAAMQIAPNSQVSVVHAYELWFENWIGLGHGVDEPTLALLEDLANDARAKLAAYVARAGLDATGTRQLARYGYAGRIVTRAAQDLGVDLVVLGTHGKSTLQQVTLGSVAEHVLRESHCDVLLVPPQGRSLPPD